MEDKKLYAEGVRKLIGLGNGVSELYREMHEMSAHLQESNGESIRYDEFYLRELLNKQEGLRTAYNHLVLQICINECFDMKSWRVGEYSYDRHGVAEKVEEFNAKHGMNLHLEDVLKSLRFDYGMDIRMSRAEKV